MQAIIDKCSCGSPRIGLSKLQALHSDHSTISSHSKKLDTGSASSHSNKNEYIKPTVAVPSSGTLDERRRNTGKCGTNSGIMSQSKREETNNSKNVQLHQQPNVVSVEATAVQHAKTLNRESESNRSDKQPQQNNTKEAESNYTTLNYDANYVKVSPPKMTRRPKRDSSSADQEAKLTREAQLQASRAETGRDSVRAPAPGPDTGSLQHSILNTTEVTDVCSRSGNKPEIAATDASSSSVVTNRNTEYIALSDLQSGGAVTKPEFSNGSIVAKAEVVDDRDKVNATIYKDGENSFLKFTFTVKLDGDAKKSSGPSVVSGTVNIVQPALVGKTANNPLVTVGLQQGGVVIATEQRPLESDNDNNVAVSPCELKSNQQPKLEADDDVKPSEVDVEPAGNGTDSMYHSLLASERDQSNAVDTVYEGFQQLPRDQLESTHMSWEEVMLEAQSLGIPLRLPAITNPRPRQIDSIPDPTASIYHQYSMTGDEQLPAKASQTTRNTSPPTVQQSNKSSSSPLKDKFRLQNLFNGWKWLSSKQNKQNCVVSNSGGQDTGSNSHTLPARSAVGTSTSAAGRATVKRGVSVESPCFVRRRPATAAGSQQQRHTARSSSTSRAVSSGHRTICSTTTRHHRHTDPSAVGHCACMSPSATYRRLQSYDTDTLDGLCYHASTAYSFKSGTMTLGSSQISSYNSSKFSGDFISSLRQLHKCAWYWGALDFDEAESRLAGLPDGSFLVRDSSDDRYILSLSFRSLGGTHHTRIEHYGGMFSFYSQKSGYEASNIVDFVNNAVLVSRSGYCLCYLKSRSAGSIPTPVRLLYPVNIRPASLLELSCIVIQRQVSHHDAIDQLPVSADLKLYIKQFDHGV